MEPHMLRVVELDGGGHLRKASSKREWMDNAPHSYRCLPLTMSNCLGWEILTPGEVVAIWDGGDQISSVKVLEGHEWAASHFGAAVLTFHVWALIRTPLDVNLWVGGPANNPKANISPLEGIVESDWAPMSFTMNWRFTKIGHAAVFLAGEAIARIFPIPRGFVERFQIENMAFEDMPADEKAAYEQWVEKRTAWFTEPHPPQWQKDYFRNAKQRPKGCSRPPD
jgi:hypothetical protein